MEQLKKSLVTSSQHSSSPSLLQTASIVGQSHYSTKPYSPKQLQQNSSEKELVRSKIQEQLFIKGNSNNTLEQHQKIIGAYNSNDQYNTVQSTYYNYLNSFQNEVETINKAPQPLQLGQQRKSTHQSTSNLHQVNSQNIQPPHTQQQFHSKLELQRNNINSSSQILSIKHNQQLQDKYQSYGGAVDMLQQNQIAFKSQYSSQSNKHKIDSFRNIGSSNYTGSPSHIQNNGKIKNNIVDLNKKSLTKENQSNTSLGFVRAKQSQQNTANKKNGKNRNRIVKTSMEPENIIGFYKSTINNKTPKKEQVRYDEIEEILNNKIIKAQQINNNQLSHGKQLSRKNSNQRNKVQIKLKTMNIINPNFEMLDNNSSQQVRNIALTAKHTNNASQNQVQNPFKDSFTHLPKAGPNSDINGHIIISDEIKGKKNTQTKLKQKINSIIQATSMNSSNTFLQNSLSSGNLHKETSAISNQQKQLFRPQSLKQLMPTIDEQISKLQENQNYHGLNSEQLGGHFLFQTLTTKNQQSKSLRQIPTHPSSQFRGQIIKTINNGNKANRNIPSQFNHKESIECHNTQGSNNVLSTSMNKEFDNNDSMKVSLNDILQKTSTTIHGLLKREKLLTIKCSKYEQEILYLKNKLLKYESDL